MIKHIQIQVLPKEGKIFKFNIFNFLKYLKINQSKINHIEILKKSISLLEKNS